MLAKWLLSCFKRGNVKTMCVYSRPVQLWLKYLPTVFDFIHIPGTSWLEVKWIYFFTKFLIPGVAADAAILDVMPFESLIKKITVDL